jgi:NitT/TauT family transport system substrate-binding protein
VKSLVAAFASVCVTLVCFAQTTQTPVRVAYCARTVSSLGAPYAVAQKMGWFAKDGIQLELVPIAGSSDCVKFLATRQVDYAGADVAPLAIIHSRGVNARVFYTYNQRFIGGIAVPEGSPIKTFADLKGKSIGVIAMGSSGVIVARAVVASAGLNPDTDIRIVVAGEGAQTAALLRKKEVDALSQYDGQYAMIENAGIKLRLLESREMESFPSNGLAALDETLRSKRSQAVALAQGFAKGTLFTIANPEAAIRILWEVFPQTKPTSKDEATALKDELNILSKRIPKWKPETGGASKWGENSEKHFADYLAFLEKWGVITQKVPAADLITNDLIAEINNFDQAKIVAEARAYKWRPDQ